MMNLQHDPVPFGAPSLLTRRDIVATITSLIKHAWERVCARSDVDSASTEPLIAGALYLELEQEKKRRKLRGPLIIEENPTRSRESMLVGDGRIDLKVFYSTDSDDFLGLEYKKIDSNDRSLAKLYIEQGMRRFITAKYCPGHDVVTMAGFVMDANPAGAARLIQAQIDHFRTSLSIHEEWTVETSYNDIEHIYRTKHMQARCSRPFTMLHLMLPYLRNVNQT